MYVCVYIYTHISVCCLQLSSCCLGWPHSTIPPPCVYHANRSNCISHSRGRVYIRHVELIPLIPANKGCILDLEQVVFTEQCGGQVRGGNSGADIMKRNRTPNSGISGLRPVQQDGTKWAYSGFDK